MTPPSGGATGGRWSDLWPRLATGTVLSAIAIGAMAAGGTPLALFVALCVTVIVWELASMVSSRVPLLLAGTAGGCLFAVAILPEGYGLPLLLLPVFIAVGRIGRERLSFAAFSGLALLAGFGLLHLRSEFGLIWILWLVAVVVATDLLGYFAGKLIGGPKFWPAVSPKKTWAGIVAGWVGAGIAGAVFARLADAEYGLIGMSVALSMAAQFGDIAESAMKRRVGVKDSSNLLPGHGGFFDRFDGVLGASVFLLMIEQAAGFPPLRG